MSGSDLFLDALLAIAAAESDSERRKSLISFVEQTEVSVDNAVDRHAALWLEKRPADQIDRLRMVPAEAIMDCLRRIRQVRQLQDILCERRLKFAPLLSAVVQRLVLCLGGSVDRKYVIPGAAEADVEDLRELVAERLALNAVDDGEETSKEKTTQATDQQRRDTDRHLRGLADKVTTDKHGNSFLPNKTWEDKVWSLIEHLEARFSKIIPDPGELHDEVMEVVFKDRQGVEIRNPFALFSHEIWRQRGRRRKPLPLLSQAAMENQVLESVAADPNPPESPLTEAELRQFFHEHSAGLCFRERELLIAHVIDGFAPNEMAQKMYYLTDKYVPPDTLRKAKKRNDYYEAFQKACREAGY